MDKHEKNFAKGMVFRCEKMRALACKYYEQEISESDFVNGLVREIFLIGESFMIKKGIKI